jgi:uncharacterized HAD superfamily protein
MIKQNLIKSLSVIVLFMLSISLLYNSIQLKNTVDLSIGLIKEYKSKQIIDSLENNFLINNVVKQLENSGAILNNVMIEDFNNKTYQLKELIKDRSKLIFMFSELNCQTCIDMQLPNIEQLSKDIGAENIILLASYSNKRDLVQFARINNIKLEIYNFDKSEIEIPLIDTNVPFFFILNPNLTSTCFFIPEKSMPKHTIAYLNIVKHRFFNQLNSSIYGNF